MSEKEFVYAIRNKETGKFLKKSNGGKYYSILGAAKSRINGDEEYEIVTYRLIELGVEMHDS